MKSVVYISTATSGSASLHRVISALTDTHLKTAGIPEVEGRKPSIDDFDPEDRLYLIRGTREVAMPIVSDRFRYIVNFRDPRDILCNQYYWLIQHPPGEEKDAEKRDRTIAERKARFDLGIDASVLRVRDDGAFAFVFAMQQAAEAGADVLFVSYAQLCCRFETMVERMRSFLAVTPSAKSLEKISLEHPDNLNANPRWIGQNWVGTDILPGRFRTELKPETITIVNERFRETLDRLKSLEIPELRHLYEN